jgi:serine/threonine protein phosphatase 1
VNGYIRKFERNLHGRDFVVGDIHGCFDMLRQALEEVGFDELRDRLFSVGDLVDRGPDSIEAVDWIAKPWFHAVRGNHEQMAIGVAAGRHDLGNYLFNGGGWFLALEGSRQQSVASVLESLPVCIEVDTASGAVGMVHADIAGSDWADFVSKIEAPASKNQLRLLLEEALWSRDRIRSGDCSGVVGLIRMYVGHTPVDAPVALGNVHYIDTGAVFGRALTLVCIHDCDDLQEFA